MVKNSATNGIRDRLLVTASYKECVMSPGAIVFGLIIGALVGWLIGRNKGLGAIGIVLGGLLGFIGWIIVAVMKGDQVNNPNV